MGKKKHKGQKRDKQAFPVLMDPNTPAPEPSAPLPVKPSPLRNVLWTLIASGGAASLAISVSWPALGLALGTASFVALLGMFFSQKREQASFLRQFPTSPALAVPADKGEPPDDLGGSYVLSRARSHIIYTKKASLTFETLVGYGGAGDWSLDAPHTPPPPAFWEEREYEHWALVSVSPLSLFGDRKSLSFLIEKLSKAFDAKRKRPLSKAFVQLDPAERIAVAYLPDRLSQECIQRMEAGWFFHSPDGVFQCWADPQTPAPKGWCEETILALDRWFVDQQALPRKTLLRLFYHVLKSEDIKQKALCLSVLVDLFPARPERRKAIHFCQGAEETLLRAWAALLSERLEVSDFSMSLYEWTILLEWIADYANTRRDSYWLSAQTILDVHCPDWSDTFQELHDGKQTDLCREVLQGAAERTRHEMALGQDGGLSFPLTTEGEGQLSLSVQEGGTLSTLDES